MVQMVAANWRNAEDDDESIVVNAVPVAILTAVVTIAIWSPQDGGHLSVLLKGGHRLQPKKQGSTYWLARSEQTSTHSFCRQQAAWRQLLHPTIDPDSLWQMIPYLNTGLMRMIFASEGRGDVSDEDIEQFKSEGTVSEEISELTREGTSVFNDRNFLDFEGDFNAELIDNESRIDLNQLNSDLPIQEIPPHSSCSFNELEEASTGPSKTLIVGRLLEIS